jgi:hypothetical protein
LNAIIIYIYDAKVRQNLLELQDSIKSFFVDIWIRVFGPPKPSSLSSRTRPGKQVNLKLVKITKSTVNDRVTLKFASMTKDTVIVHQSEFASPT